MWYNGPIILKYILPVLKIKFLVKVIEKIYHSLRRLFLFFKDFIYLFIFRETGREGDRQGARETSLGERDTDRLLLAHSQLGGLAHTPGLCLDWASNQ